MEIGERIRKCRKSKDLTLEEMAKLVDLSRQTLSRYETGVITNIPSDKIETIAKALDVSPGYLMGWEEQLAKATEGAVLIERFQSLSVEEQRKALDSLDEVHLSSMSDPTVSIDALRMHNAYLRSDKRTQQMVDLALEPFMERLDPVIKKRKDMQPKLKRRKDGFIEIVVFEDQLPAAGYGSYFDKPAFHMEQYPADIIPPDTTFAIPISGNSMEPRFKDHSIVFVKSVPRVDPGDIGLFALNGEPYIKQLMIDEEKREVRLHSINGDYSDIIVHEFDDLRTFGKIIGSYFVN